MKIYKIEVPVSELETYFIKVSDDQGEEDALSLLTEYLALGGRNPNEDEENVVEEADIFVTEPKRKSRSTRPNWLIEQIEDSAECNKILAYYFDPDMDYIDGEEDEFSWEDVEDFGWEDVDSEEDDDDSFLDDIRDMAGL